MVREWFERAATAPARVDATGRRLAGPRPAAVPSGDACDVPVRAHSRAGGEVQVEAHCRSRPAA
jgi:hypothetical protein